MRFWYREGQTPLHRNVNVEVNKVMGLRSTDEGATWGDVNEQFSAAEKWRENAAKLEKERDELIVECAALKAERETLRALCLKSKVAIVDFVFGDPPAVSELLIDLAHATGGDEAVRRILSKVVYRA